MGVSWDRRTHSAKIAEFERIYLLYVSFSFVCSVHISVAKPANSWSVADSLLDA